eukprot:406386_1
MKHKFIKIIIHKCCNIRTLLKLFIIWLLILFIIACKLLMISNSPPPIHNRNIETLSSITKNTIKSNQEKHSPGLPAFIVIGPPKSGTTSLVHTFASSLDNFLLKPGDNGEHHFWNGANTYTCLPDYDNITWNSFIYSWKHKKIKLTSLNHSIWTSHIIHPRVCTTSKYESIWQWIMCKQHSNATDKICYVPMDHHKQKYCAKNQIIDINIKNKYCYFIESSPSYLRNPLIGIMYAMNMPRIKLLGIIRNPVNMWWSWCWHYYSHLFDKTENGLQKLERWVFNVKLHAYPETLIPFEKLRTECKRINIGSQNMDYNEKFEIFYRDFMALYLKLRFIDETIEPHVRREPDAMIYSTLIFPTFLFWIQSFDEIYGRNFNNEWNNLRFVQFEWLYANKKESFNMIHCWVVYGVYNCPFKHSNSFDNVLRLERQAYGSYSDYWSESVQKLYVDCNHALQSVLLKDRPGLLIGEWIDWGY